MNTTAISSECWWIILHHGHHAWYQRGLVAADFRPGLAPSSRYIVDEQGRHADPDAVLVCTTCGEVPAVEDLEPVERIGGATGFLAAYRSGRRPWPLPEDAGLMMGGA